MDVVENVKLPFKLFKKGKVRDVFEIDGNLLIVSTDRISAFDYILKSLIPEKGKILNQISAFWFKYTKDFIKNHIICDEPYKLDDFKEFSNIIKKRAVLVKKLDTFPIEAIVRGYIVGSGWKSYEKTGEISGVKCPSGLKFADKFPEPIFTPTTKSEKGHDENIDLKEMEKMIGKEYSERIRDLSIKLYKFAKEYALKKGIIIADTKFEFGRNNRGDIILIDEIFTPDSSRFWKVEDYSKGVEPPSFDKQFVRNFLLNSSWDMKSNPPELPDDVISKTREKYLDIYKILAGETL